MELENIGKGPVHLSVHLSVHPHTFLHDGWMDFLHIGYHDQVPCVVEVWKITFGSVPNWSNYGYLFINVECLLRYLRVECDEFVHICGTVIKYHASLMLVK